jgi:hypothetical protein
MRFECRVKVRNLDYFCLLGYDNLQFYGRLSKNRMDLLPEWASPQIRHPPFTIQEAAIHKIRVHKIKTVSERHRDATLRAWVRDYMQWRAEVQNFIFQFLNI